MPERTAAEVLAEKMKSILRVAGPASDWVDEAAARLAEDPAITVRTDMVVERFVVERSYLPRYAPRTAEDIHAVLTSGGYFSDDPDHRIIVRPYPEATDA